MKYIIKIDTTTRSSSKVELSENSKTIDKLEGDIDIVSSIKELLAKNKIDITEIAEVIPNTGPGSFTGIKKGITVANTLNWILGLDKTYKPEYGGEPNIN